MSLNAKPLAGLKVIELGTLIAGPFASRICAEFGAEVIKVESPDGGDPLRKWRKLYEGTSLWWFVQARNKKSLTLNLKHPDGLAILKQLLADADILIENFRPGVLEKLGLSWETLHALNPKLVMVRLSGFGQTEADWARSRLRVGLEFSSDSHDNNTFQFKFMHVLSSINDWGAELRTVASIARMITTPAPSAAFNIRSISARARIF